MGMCVVPLVHKPRDNRDAAYALLLYAAIGALTVYALGVGAYLLGIVLPHAIAAHVQIEHNTSLLI